MEFSVTPFDKNMVYFCYFAKEEDMAQYRDMEKFMAKYADVADLVKIDNFYKGDVSGLFVKLAPQTKYIAFVFGIDGNNKPLTDTWVEQAFKTGEGTTKEMYTVFDETQKTLTYFYDGKRKSRQGTVELLEQRTYEVFETYADKVLKVIIDKSFKDAPLTATLIGQEYTVVDGENCTISNYLFLMEKNIGYTYTQLLLTQATQIDGLANINTGKFTSMERMFYSFAALTSIDLSSFNTSNVTDFSAMFYNCKSLTTLDVSSFNTSNATDLSRMFYDCKKLTSLDVSKFNTSKVTDMSFMFSSCLVLNSLDVSHFNTEKVTRMCGMFRACNVPTLDVTSFNTSNVTDMSDMFEATDLSTIDLSHFNTSKVTTMENMFSFSDFVTLDLRNFDMNNVVTAKGMFAWSQKLTTIYCNEDWSLKINIEDSKGMFAYCPKLKGEMGTEWNSANPDDKTYARPDKGPDQPGYFTTK